MFNRDYDSSVIPSFISALACLLSVWAPNAHAIDVLNINLTTTCRLPTVVDVHAPTAFEGRPIVLVLHGGGWRQGSRFDVRSFAQQLAQAGFITVNVDYFKSEAILVDKLIKLQLNNVKCVRNWAARVLGTNMKANVKSIGIVGHSAGGHLAVTSALLGGPNQYQGYVGWGGVYQLSEFTHMPVAQAKSIDPIALVRKKTSRGLLVHGTADATVPFARAQAFYEAMRAAKQDVSWLTIQGTHAIDSPQYIIGTAAFLWESFRRRGASEPGTTDNQRVWRCSVGMEGTGLWMRSTFAGTPQYAWRIGAGGAMAELRDSAQGNVSLLAPSFGGEVTDRVPQWTIWNFGLALGSNQLDRMNVTQAGTGSNVLTPIMGVHWEQTENGCTAAVLSHPKDQWTPGQAARFTASFPALTVYHFAGGLLTITRQVLVQSLSRDGQTIHSTDFYFEGWTTFSDREFDAFALSLDKTGKPNWWYKDNLNIPKYKWTNFASTRGWSVVYRTDRTASGPVIGLVFGKAKNSNGIMRQLNSMDFPGGLAILPSLKSQTVPMGSVITQQLKMYMTRGVSAQLAGMLDLVAETVDAPDIIRPDTSTSASVARVRPLLQSTQSLPSVRTDNLAQAPRFQP